MLPYFAFFFTCLGVANYTKLIIFYLATFGNLRNIFEVAKVNTEKPQTHATNIHYWAFASKRIFGTFSSFYFFFIV